MTQVTINLLDRIGTIQPAPFDVAAMGSRLAVTLPAAAMAAIEVELE
jgi:hypothetical protein